MPGLLFSLIRRRGSEHEAWMDRTRGDMKTKRQRGPKEEQDGVDQKNVNTKIRRWQIMNGLEIWEMIKNV